jgi:hypothetical protein
MRGIPGNSHMHLENAQLTEHCGLRPVPAEKFVKPNSRGKKVMVHAFHPRNGRKLKIVGSGSRQACEKSKTLSLK